MTDNSITRANGDSIIISLKEPYTNTVEIVSYEDVVLYETDTRYFKKYFRWGLDGVTYSDWVDLTNENLNKLILNPNNNFWIEYKYEQIGDGTLKFESISLEIVTESGILNKMPQIQCSDSNALSGTQNLVVNCCDNNFNPYDLTRPQQLYNQLSSVISNIFGFCVKYYKTAADQRSKDVILKEYSLYNVISTKSVKILVPDNEMPTREAEFGPLMIDFQFQFEVHIVKSEFERAFGVGSRPEVSDYLYFEQYLNKVYEVNSVIQSDIFNGESYWRVSLVVYQQRAALEYSDVTIEEEINNTVTNLNKFEEERDDEFLKTRKPNQYNTIGTLSNDYVRRILNKGLSIKEENVYNNFTIISKYHYKLNSIDLNSVGIEYQYTGGWSSTDNRSFTFWFRPTNPILIGNNILITSISNTSGKVKLGVSELPTDSKQKLNVGDYIKISGTNSYNGIHKIIAISDTSIDINAQYVDNVYSGTPRFNKEFHNTLLVYENSTERYFSITQTTNWIILTINNTEYKYNISVESIVANNWYSVVINLNNTANQLSLFLYKIVNTTNNSTTLTLIQKETKDILNISLVSDNAWKLIGANSDITNIRIWKKPIEEELHELILSQYVVRDTHLSLLLDNSSPQLLLNRVQNPR